MTSKAPEDLTGKGGDDDGMERGLRWQRPADDPDWDRRLESDPEASVFHTSWWSRALTDSYGYRPLYPALGDDGPENDGFLPLMEVRSRVTGRRAVGLPFSDESPAIERAGRVRDLLPNLFEHGRGRGWRYVEIRGCFEGCEDLTQASSQFFHRLALTTDEDSLLAGMRSSSRRNLRKAFKSSLTLHSGTEWALVETFYDLQCHTRRRHGLPPQPRSFFRALHRHALEPGHGETVLALRDGSAVAGAVFLHHGSRSLYKYGASLPEGAELRGNYLVMWEGIRQAAHRGSKSFCFGRTEPENEGLRRFKQGWGTVESAQPYFRYDLRGEHWTTVPSAMFGWHNRVFARLPVGMLQLLGTALYRHMA